MITSEVVTPLWVMKLVDAGCDIVEKCNILLYVQAEIDPEGVILPIVTLETIRPEDSGAAQNATEFRH